MSLFYEVKAKVPLSSCTQSISNGVDDLHLVTTSIEGALGDFGTHIIKLLNQWISTFPQDFRDESMMRNLMAFTKALEQHDRSELRLREMTIRGNECPVPGA